MDRFSNLPYNAMYGILWLLPMKDFVRVSTLSKFWRDRCATTPFLNLENRTIPFESTILVQDFVNRAVDRWNGIKLRKFKFETCHESKPFIYPTIDKCVRFAVKHRVEELYLHMLNECFTLGIDDTKEGHYEVPHCLYSSGSSLKELSIRHCIFNTIDEDVGWKQLKRLTITEGVKVTTDVMDHILSGSSQLEVLILSFLETDGDLSIESSSLKELSINKCLFYQEELNLNTQLSICAPNVKNIAIEGTPFSECLLENVSSLTHATIGLSCVHLTDWEEGEFNWADSEGEYESGLEFVGMKFRQVLQSIQLVRNVTRVTLSCGCIKVLEAMKENSPQSSFPNVKILKIGCCYNDYEQLVGLLDIFPQLKSLVLQHERENHYPDYPDSLKFDAKSYPNLPDSFLLQLRTVDVTWAEGEGDNVFPFIEVLLKYASKLENLVFRVREKNEAPAPPLSVILASKYLLRMPRSSPSCIIDFL